LGRIHSLSSPGTDGSEADLIAQRQREEERRNAWEQQNQIDRLALLEQQQASSGQTDAVSDGLKQQGKSLAKTMVKDAAYEEAAAAGSAVVASFPVWGPIVGFVLVVCMIIGMSIFIMSTVMSYCNQSGVTGFFARAGSTIANKVGFTSGDYCSSLSLSNIGATAQTNAPTTTVPATGGTSSDEINRKFLADNGISVNKPYPTTSLAGMRQATVVEILSFKQSCNDWSKINGGTCTVIVTGGTENVHAEGTCSHQNGYKADLGVSATIDKYITSKFKDIGIRSDGARMYRSPTGALYARETKPDHWDVLVGCSANG
jgi:hypothetical protein